MQEYEVKRQPDAEPTVLASAEAFDERRGNAELRDKIGLSRTADEIGARSRTVRRRIRSSCAGWPNPPTSEEFRNAMQASEPSDRQQDIVTMWVLEATWTEMLLAWAEEAYSWRELVNAIHAAGAARDHPERNQDLNSLSTR